MPWSVEGVRTPGLWAGCRGATQGLWKEPEWQPGHEVSHSELCGQEASAPVPCRSTAGRLLPGRGSRVIERQGSAAQSGAVLTGAHCSGALGFITEQGVKSACGPQVCSEPGRARVQGLQALWAVQSCSRRPPFPFISPLKPTPSLASSPTETGRGLDLGRGVPTPDEVLVGSCEHLPGQELLSLLLMDLGVGDPSRLVLGENAPPDPHLRSQGLPSTSEMAAAGVTDEVCHNPLLSSEHFCLLHRPKWDLIKVSMPASFKTLMVSRALHSHGVAVLPLVTVLRGRGLQGFHRAFCHYWLCCPWDPVCTCLPLPLTCSGIRQSLQFGLPALFKVDWGHESIGLAVGQWYSLGSSWALTGLEPSVPFPWCHRPRPREGLEGNLVCSAAVL